jgi:hypothetical protein
MKQLVIMMTMIMMSINIASAASKHITIEVHGGGEIRHGGFFAVDPTFTSFKDEFKKQLAKKISVSFAEGNVDYLIQIETTFNRGSFYSLAPYGLYEASVTNLEMSRQFYVGFKCGFEVNDGGNVTLKKRCAAKLARKVKHLLREF